MSNKQYRLERLKQGTKLREAEAKAETSKARLQEAKSSVPKYKAQKAQAQAEAEKYRAIARKSKAGNIVKRLSGNIRFKPQLSKSLLSYGGGYTQQGGNKVQGQRYATAGRPRGSLKWVSPFTGRRIPAPQYYKEVRQFRRMQEQKAELTQAQQLQQMAKRGVPPNQVAIMQLRQRQMQQAQNIQDMQRPRIPQQINPQQIPIQNQQQQVNPNQVDINQLPNGTVLNNQNPIWRWGRRVVDSDWTAFGTKKVIRGGEESFWN